MNHGLSDIIAEIEAEEGVVREDTQSSGLSKYAEALAAEAAPVETVLIGPKGQGKAYTVIGRTQYSDTLTLVWLERNGRYSYTRNRTGRVQRNSALSAVRAEDVPSF